MAKLRHEHYEHPTLTHTRHLAAQPTGPVPAGYQPPRSKSKTPDPQPGQLSITNNTSQ